MPKPNGGRQRRRGQRPVRVVPAAHAAHQRLRLRRRIVHAARNRNLALVQGVHAEDLRTPDAAVLRVRDPARCRVAEILRAAFRAFVLAVLRVNPAGRSRRSCTYACTSYRPIHHEREDDEGVQRKPRRSRRVGSIGRGFPRARRVHARVSRGGARAAARG